MAGDIEAFLKMAAERRRQAQAGQGQAGQGQAGSAQAGSAQAGSAQANQGQGGQNPGGGNTGPTPRYRGQTSGRGDSGRGDSGGQGGRGGQRPSSSGGQRGNQGAEPERRTLRSSLSGERDMLDPVLLDDVTLDPYAQADDLPDRPKSGKERSKAKPQKKPAPGDAGRLKPSGSASVGSSLRAGSDPHDPARHAGRGGGISEEIVRMLQTPASIPAAIVLSEILRPRDFDRDDWD